MILEGGIKNLNFLSFLSRLYLKVPAASDGAKLSGQKGGKKMGKRFVREVAIVVVVAFLVGITLFLLNGRIERILTAGLMVGLAVGTVFGPYKLLSRPTMAYSGLGVLASFAGYSLLTVVM
ncbi:MAG: hypothetical protein ABIF89_00955 [bacterium]